MQRIVAEAGQLVLLPFVNGVMPVNVEEILDNGGHLVHIVGIEGDDAHSHEVGDVGDAMVLITFLGQFASQRLLGIDAMLNGIQLDALFFQDSAEKRVDSFRQLFQLWTQLTELTQECFAVR